MSYRGVEDNMTMRQVDRLHATWARNGPPLYITMAASVGWKSRPEQSEDQTFDELMRMLGSG